MIKSIDFLASTLLGAPVTTGHWPLGHTLHARSDVRRAGIQAGETTDEVARRRDRLATKPKPADELAEKSESDAKAADARRRRRRSDSRGRKGSKTVGR